MDDLDGLRVYPRHLVQMKHCLIPGVRDWMVAHGFDWRDFIYNGIEAKRVMATGDALGIAAVRTAQQEQQHGR